MGTRVLTPTQIPLDLTNSKVYGSFLLAFPDGEMRTSFPGLSNPSMLPELLQWTQKAPPFAFWTSIRNLLSLRRKRASHAPGAKDNKGCGNMEKPSWASKVVSPIIIGLPSQMELIPLGRPQGLRDQTVRLRSFSPFARRPLLLKPLVRLLEISGLVRVFVKGDTAQVNGLGCSVASSMIA